MELKFTIDTDDIYERDTDFEHLLTESLSREIIKNANGKFASEKFKEFATLTSDTIVAETKLKMMNFLSEEIVLTERYGEKSFVGSVEDLLKLRFDDILLRPVDSSGKTLQGCTSSGKTWIEWEIERRLQDSLKRIVDNASKEIERKVTQAVNGTLIEFKDKAIKDQVDNTFASILQKHEQK
jgi:hypothetical protein